MVVLPGLGMEAQSLRAGARATNLALERARRLGQELGLELVRFPEPLPTLELAAVSDASPQPEAAAPVGTATASTAAPAALAPLHGPLGARREPRPPMLGAVERGGWGRALGQDVPREERTTVDAVRLERPRGGP